MPTMPEDTQTVTTSIPLERPAKTEKFNVGDFIIAATSVMNNQHDRIERLERHIFWMKAQILILLGGLSYAISSILGSRV